MPTHTRVDAKLGHDLHQQGAQVHLELLAQNLLNHSYYDFYLPNSSHNGNLFDRRVYGQVLITQ